MLSEVFVVILGVIIILLIIYMYIKDQDTNKKFKILATRSDTINRQLFTLSKNLSKEIDNHKKEMEIEISLAVDSNNSNHFQIDTSEINSIKQALEKVMYDVENIQGINSRVLSLETGMKNAVLDRNSSVDKSQQIVTFYKDGRSIEEISRELHISRTEVEFALKLARI